MFTFQEIIQKLHAFWEKQGCIIQLGHNVEVGAATFNPSTFLRALGPEPYKTAYVELCKRPQDGRYGQNPNRVQLFHQYQVIIKPSVHNIQELYLESLQAIGIDLTKHDIRFVHDDWESPTLGASGLGWEVWLDGMEVTQFTYFQIVGGIELDTITAEIAYGLERLAMYLQKVDSIFDLAWNDTYTFRDLNLASEIEWSQYNFEEANIPLWSHAFADYEKEANRLIENGLPIVAYDFVLKASHAFNMLNARGVISTTERAHYIARIRDLARKTALLYLDKRKEAGFPLLKHTHIPEKKTLKKKDVSFFPEGHTDCLLLEIGSEELPATFVPIGMKSLKDGLTKLFHTSGLRFTEIKMFGTPRRLATQIFGLHAMSEKQMIEKKGPLVSMAFDEKGDPKEQGKGFLRSINAPEDTTLSMIRDHKVKHLSIETIKGQEHLYIKMPSEPKMLGKVLQENLAELIKHMDFPKKMVWDETKYPYPRPLSWIVSLYGETPIPVEVAGILSSRLTYGHAQRGNISKEIPSSVNYEQVLASLKVIPCPEKRKERILHQLSTLEQKHQALAVKKSLVLSQVLYLSEYPELIVEEFDQEFLKVPQEILISEMVEHQKYFPLSDPNGLLLNQFVITADNTPSESIKQGNKKVLSARLADGAFLFAQDAKLPLEHYREKLKNITWQKTLGSLWDKSERLEKGVELLCETLQEPHKTDAARGARLAKADLATTLVSEFPELQGIIGRIFALHHGESPEVAAAIEEHWMPLGEEAPLPLTRSGIVVALADKLDTLLGFFAVGLKPTSSGDPYALRRSALGILRILIDKKIAINLREHFQTLIPTFSPPIQKVIKESNAINEVLSFITARAKAAFERYHISKDVIEASVQTECLNPFDEFEKAKALEGFKQTSRQFYPLLEVYKRAKGQLNQAKGGIVFDAALLQEAAEITLHHELVRCLHEISLHKQRRAYHDAFIELSKLQPHLARLFDEVKILADDPKIQTNRLGLLQLVLDLFNELLDFGKISQT